MNSPNNIVFIQGGHERTYSNIQNTAFHRAVTYVSSLIIYGMKAEKINKYESLNT